MVSLIISFSVDRVSVLKVRCLVSHPYPFKCSIAPRDKQAEGLISQTASEA